MVKTDKDTLTENHRRGISATLTLLDELLAEILLWVDGRQDQGVLVTEINDLSRHQRTRLRLLVTEIRQHLEMARKEFGLPVSRKSAVSSIWSQCLALRESLIELEGRRLQRYGALSAAWLSLLDEYSRLFLKDLDTLVALLKRSHRKTASPGEEV